MLVGQTLAKPAWRRHVGVVFRLGGSVPRDSVRRSAHGLPLDERRGVGSGGAG